MNLQVLKLKDLIESPHGVPDPTNPSSTNKIYRLERVIDASGTAIGFPQEIEVVVEIMEIGS